MSHVEISFLLRFDGKTAVQDYRLVKHVSGKSDWRDVVPSQQRRFRIFGLCI
tara:strand:+ start:416 stop:571 length:156 start_codon:yes stop_codon:yes gene_type:complete